MPATHKKRPTRSKSSVLDEDARELQRALSELVRVYQFRDRTSICYYDISVTQCYALSCIINHGPMTLNGLASELYLDKSTASRVVASLVRKGYVSRAVDRSDARAVRLESTDKGRELESKIQWDLLPEMKALVSGYSPDARRATARLLSRLARAAAGKFGGGRGIS